MDTQLALDATLALVDTTACITTLGSDDWLTVHGIRGGQDALCLPEGFAFALASLPRSRQYEVLADICAMRAAAHQRMAGPRGPRVTVPEDLDLSDDLDRVFSGSALAILGAVGVDSIGALFGPQVPRVVLCPRPRARGRGSLLRGLAAIEAWGARFWRAEGEQIRACEGFDTDLSAFCTHDAGHVLLGLDLAHRGLLHVRADADEPGVQFIVAHPRHLFGQAVLFWSRARPEGVGEC
jgi:hypothetical protein